MKGKDIKQIELSDGKILFCNNLFSRSLVYEVQKRYQLTKELTDELYWKWWARDYWVNKTK